MNMRGIANRITKTVNSNIFVNWVQSTGYTTDAAGHRTPTITTTQIEANVQALQGSDIRHVDMMNMQGVMRSVYLYGNIQGIVRADGKGGDILQFPEVPGGASKNWLVSQVMETWPNWCRVLVTLQQS